MKNNESNDHTDEMRVTEAIENLRAEAGRRFSQPSIWRNWSAVLVSLGQSFGG